MDNAKEEGDTIPDNFRQTPWTWPPSDYSSMPSAEEGMRGRRERSIHLWKLKEKSKGEEMECVQHNLHPL